MAKLDYSVGAIGKEIVMTLNVSVTDDQLGQYYRRTMAIADRLGKSLSFRDVMETLQRIHDGEFGQLGTPVDFIIRVDRSVKPNYPHWAKEVVDLELERTGPTEYDLSQVEMWVHREQKRGFVQGKLIHEHLWKDGSLATCLNLQDGRAIQQKGIAVFRKFFGRKKVFLWGSVVRTIDDLLNVPYLCTEGDRVVVGWLWVGNRWDFDYPALRFRKE